MDSVVFRPLEAGDIQYIAANLCVGEREVIRSNHGDVDLLQVVSRAVLLSEKVEVAVRMPEGQPLALIGVAPVSIMEGAGNLWMLATDAAFEDARFLVRGGRRYVSRLAETYPVLVGRVDARLGGVLKWLRLMGFTVGAPARDGEATYCNFRKVTTSDVRPD